jgi:hypothetical protein
LGPWAMGAAVLTKIRRARRGSWLGKIWERLRGSPALDLRARTGRGMPTASRVVACRDHDRDELCSGELPAWEEKRAVR